MNEWLVGGLRGIVPLGLAVFAAAYSLPRSYRRDEKLIPRQGVQVWSPALRVGTPKLSLHGRRAQLGRRYRIAAALCCAVLLLCPALAAGPGCAFLTCPHASALMADGLEAIGAGVAWALVGLHGDRQMAKPERWALGVFAISTSAVALVEIAAAPLSPDAGDLLILICAAARHAPAVQSLLGVACTVVRRSRPTAPLLRRLLASSLLALFLGWGARRSSPQNLMVDPLPPIDPSGARC